MRQEVWIFLGIIFTYNKPLLGMKALMSVTTNYNKAKIPVWRMEAQS